MSIDWWTVGLQVVNFAVLVAILYRFLYRPVTRVIARRTDAIAEQFAEAEAERDRAAAMAEEHEQALASLAEEQDELRKRERERQEHERREILDEARREANAIADAVRRELAKEREDILRDVRADIAQMATGLARRLLEEARFAHASEPFLARLLEHLRAMPDRRRDALIRHVSEDRPVFVVCAPPLPEELHDDWRTRIEDVLGRLPIEIGDDDVMIAGVELRFPHTNLRLCWQDAIEGAGQEARRHAGAA